MIIESSVERSDLESIISNVRWIINNQKREGFISIFPDVRNLNGKILNFNDHAILYLYFLVTKDKIEITLSEDNNKKNIFWKVVSFYKDFENNLFKLRIFSSKPYRIVYGKYILGSEFVKKYLEECDCGMYNIFDLSTESDKIPDIEDPIRCVLEKPIKKPSIQISHENFISSSTENNHKLSFEQLIEKAKESLSKRLKERYGTTNRNSN